MGRLACIVLAGACAASLAAAPAQSRQTRPKVLDVAAEPVEVIPGRTVSARVTVTVVKGFKVQANPPSEGLIATTLSMEPSEGLHLGAPAYPKSKVFALEGVGDLLVYDGTFTISLPVSAARVATPGTRTLKGTLRYQACDDTTCLLPVNTPVTIEVSVAAVSQKR